MFPFCGPHSCPRVPFPARTHAGHAIFPACSPIAKYQALGWAGPGSSSSGSVCQVFSGSHIQAIIIFGIVEMWQGLEPAWISATSHIHLSSLPSYSLDKALACMHPIPKAETWPFLHPYILPLVLSPSFLCHIQTVQSWLSTLWLNTNLLALIPF